MFSPLRTKKAEMHFSLGLDENTLAKFCQAHHISKLSLFGSQLKGTARVDSDVDLLVDEARRDFFPSRVNGCSQTGRQV
jgi:predicted nucleotidyltransferase